MKLCFGWLPAPVWQAGVAAVVGSAPCSAPSAAPPNRPTSIYPEQLPPLLAADRQQLRQLLETVPWCLGRMEQQGFSSKERIPGLASI